MTDPTPTAVAQIINDSDEAHALLMKLMDVVDKEPQTKVEKLAACIELAVAAMIDAELTDFEMIGLIAGQAKGMREDLAKQVAILPTPARVH